MFFNVLLIFSVVTLITSFVYLNIYLMKKERFIMFWGMACLVYVCSLICLIIYLHTKIDLFLELRKLIDMFNILLLLFGVIAYMHIEIPTYWYRFSLYMLLLAGVCIMYRVDLLSYYIPISIFQVVTTITTCYYIGKYRDMTTLEKTIAILAFFIWGIAKATLSILIVNNSQGFDLYTLEIMLSFLVNLCILNIYIQHIHQEVELTEHLYQTLVENTTDVIFYYKLSPYPAFEYVTPSIEAVTGYKAEFFYKDPRFYVQLIDKKYLNAVEDIFNARIQPDQGHIMEFIKKDGEKFWGEISASIITNDNDEPLAIEGVLHDITVMKSTQLEQIKAKQSRDLLLSYISHELRTPITSISGYLTAINDGTLNQKHEVKEAMEIIETKTMLLKKLVDDLDQLSKLETHQFSFEFMTCTVSDLVDSLLLEHDLQIKTTSLFTKVCYNRDEMINHWVVADVARISQVFSNLLSNAIKYSEKDSDLSVVLTVDDNKECFVVNVTNQGEAISPKDLIYIFDKFYQAGPSIGRKDVKRGRGLGLSISREIIKAHNGEIYASSENNMTTFTFTIPLFKEASDDA